MNLLLTSLFFLISFVQSEVDPINPQKDVHKAETLFPAIEGKEGQWEEGTPSEMMQRFNLSGSTPSKEEKGTSIFELGDLFEEATDWGLSELAQKSPLVLAILAHDLEKVKRLIEAKEGVHEVDKIGWTPLHYAAEGDHAEATQMLVEQKVDVNRKDIFGYTPLSIAMRHNSAAVIPLLISKLDQDGLDHSLREAARVRRTERAVQLLIEAGADVDQNQTDTGWSLLHIAAIQENGGVLELLIEAGGDLNKADKEGYTAIHRAVEYGHREIFTRLIQAGADLRQAAHSGWTLLHTAVEHRRFKIAELLLQAEPNLKDRSTSWWGFLGLGKKPIDIARKKRYTELVALLSPS